MRISDWSSDVCSSDLPLFDLIRQSYLLVSDHLLANIDEMEGLDPAQRERLRFATRAIIEAISPSNFAFTNPEVIERRSEEHTSELQSLMRISYAVFCLKNNTTYITSINRQSLAESSSEQNKN